MSKLLVRFGLRFETPQVERRFVERFTLDDLGRTQAAMVLGAIVYVSFAVWDWILDPAIWRTTLAIRLAVALCVLLPLTAALFASAARRYAEPIYLAYCVVPGCLLSVIYRLLEPGFDHAAAGMIIVILFVSTLLPLRLPTFLAFCATTWLWFAWLESGVAHDLAGLHFVNNFYLGTAYALALYAVAAREFRARRQFQTTRDLQDEKERSETALAELKRTQAHLVQAEKHASLGQLVAGVAHEVNTPIGLALTTSTALNADVRRLTGIVASGQVRRSELTEGFARLDEGARLIFANLSRAVDLVDNFKQVATDQAREERRAFEVGGWLRNLMSTLGPLLRRKGHAVRLSCPDGLVLDSYPGALGQVISNLALNAVIHGFPDGRAGTLQIEVSQPSPGGIRIVFRDDGVGIPTENLGRVFDPFFTTKRDQGSTGLGLHIVFNLVVSTLSGQIALDSRAGGGTRFIIDLPSTLPAESRRAAPEFA